MEINDMRMQQTFFTDLSHACMCTRMRGAECAVQKRKCACDTECVYIKCTVYISIFVTSATLDCSFVAFCASDSVLRVVCDFLLDSSAGASGKASPLTF